MAKPISFNLKNGTVREFTEEVHGEDFKDVAAEFEKNNGHMIVSKGKDEEEKTDEANDSTSEDTSPKKSKKA